MRILLITPYYFPYINPRAHRWTAIAEEWAKKGHEVHVICSERNDFPKKSHLNKVIVHRTGYNSLKEVFYNFFKSKKRRGEAQTTKPKIMKRSRLMTFLVWFNETFWKKIYFPDDACVWYFPARKKAIHVLKSQKIDALVSVSLPFSTHLVGLYCKRQFPEIPWVVDIGDPFSIQFKHQLNNHFLYKKLNLKFEREVLKTADSISVTTEGTKQLYEKYFSGIEHKIKAIPPLLKLDVEENSTLDLNLDSSKIHIGYFGSFFKNIREPDAFIKLLKKSFTEYPELKNRVVIHFFGDIIEHFLKTFERENNLRNNLKMYGLIPRETIPNMMFQMDFLLNISNQSDFQLPSKSVDYMVSGKPIINICSIEEDLFKAFFEEYPLIENIFLEGNDISKIQIKSFKDFLEKESKKIVDKTILGRLIEPYLTKEIAKKYFNLIDMNLVD